MVVVMDVGRNPLEQGFRSGVATRMTQFGLELTKEAFHEAVLPGAGLRTATEGHLVGCADVTVAECDLPIEKQPEYSTTLTKILNERLNGIQPVH